MSETAIIAENVSKCYRVGGPKTHYKTIRESITDTLQRWRRRATSGADSDDTFWALKDVSFEIKRGESVGIIGRNGAGKSTLLKILSRITAPTKGQLELVGRVGSLLEVGTGFHSELTGRENIFLYGAILGMGRREVASRFDEIVAFAEVDRFLDTSVKRYSSGMYMRLAFSVAAHLNPDILLVDEVLAVGDAAFQEKCLGKMKDTVSSGRTILFVSHNMAAVSQLCQRGILLNKGTVEAVGPAASIVEKYWGAVGAGDALTRVEPEKHLFGCDRLQLLHIRLLNSATGQFTVRWREAIELELRFAVKHAISNVNFGLAVFSRQGLNLIDTHTLAATQNQAFAPGIYDMRVRMENPLRAGSYVIAVGAEPSLKTEMIFYVSDAARMTVLDVGVDGAPYPFHLGGAVNTDAVWTPPQRVSD